MNLKYPMPSLNKITYGKDDLKEIKKFLRKNSPPYVISDKVDGTSLQLIYENGELNICTGGDGLVGVEVTNLKEFVNFPILEENIVIRGELTIETSKFEELIPKLRERGLKAKNSRGIINGIVNRKENDGEVLSMCNFVAFGILCADFSIIEQFEKLIELGFEVPNPVILEDVTEEDFLEILVEEHSERSKRKYRTDGVVVVSDPQFSKVVENANPDFAFAFKKNTTAVTTVTGLEWECTKYGYLAPVALIEPVEILGTTMKKAFAENAREVVEKGIGIGSLVVVTFCGDIRPKIVEVLERAEPTFPEFGYHWNESRVKILVDNPEEFPIMRILKLEHFLRVLDVKDCGEKTLEKMFKSGIDTIDKLLRVNKEDLLELGMYKSGDNFLNEMKRALERVTWPKLMAGSGIFPELIGIERCELFVREFPNWRMEEITKEQIEEVKGFGSILSEKMANSLTEFKMWIGRNPMCVPKTFKVEKKPRNLEGETVLFTGLTASELMKQEICSRGGIFKNSWVNSVTILVAKDVNSNSSKMKEAKSRGKKIMSLEEFFKLIR